MDLGVPQVSRLYLMLTYSSTQITGWRRCDGQTTRKWIGMIRVYIAMEFFRKQNRTPCSFCRMCSMLTGISGGVVPQIYYWLAYTHLGACVRAHRLHCFYRLTWENTSAHWFQLQKDICMLRCDSFLYQGSRRKDNWPSALFCWLWIGLKVLLPPPHAMITETSTPTYLLFDLYLEQLLVLG